MNWLIGFLCFGFFLAYEIYQLVKGNGGTLSEAIWRREKFRKGQSIEDWSAGHYLFTGAFIYITIWLIFHFGWGKFR